LLRLKNRGTKSIGKSLLLNIVVEIFLGEYLLEVVNTSRIVFLVFKVKVAL
jgi:hypothetical protein